MLILTDLHKQYGTFHLGPVELEIASGVTALLGANGAGKTTLMRLVVGITSATSGKVHLPDGGAAKVGYLPQDFQAPSDATVFDFLRFVCWCRSSRHRPLGDAAVWKSLEAVDLQERATSRLGALSGGMIRRVGIAQALLGNPEVLVLDEPTVGLDPVQRRDLRNLLSDLGRSRAVVISTHLSEDVSATADRVVVLESGAIAFTGSVAELAALAEGSGKQGGEAVEQGFLSVVAEAGQKQ